MRQIEVGIVGAGPAGARAAELLAAQGVDVILFDPKAPWEKPCGGGLTPPIFAELPELADIKPLARPIHRARIELGPETGFDVDLGDPIWVISRETLGKWQLERALMAGATHEAVKVESLTRTASGWVLGSDHGSWSVSYLVGADGAASTVRGIAAPGLPVELVPTRVVYPRDEGGVSDRLVLRFYGGVVGYLWDFPRPGHHSIGIEVANGGWRRPALDQKIDDYRVTSGFDPAASSVRAGAVIGTARLSRRSFARVSGDGFALLGDAAGFADPFTGEGVHNALRSARLLVQAREVARERWSETYAALAREAFSREFTVARVLRRTLSESGIGVRLVRWGVSSDLAYAAVAAILRSLTAHDYRVSRLISRMHEALSEGRPDPEQLSASGARASAR